MNEKWKTNGKKRKTIARIENKNSKATHITFSLFIIII